MLLHFVTFASVLFLLIVFRSWERGAGSELRVTSSDALCFKQIQVSG